MEFRVKGIKIILAAGEGFLLNSILGTLVTGLGNPVALGQYVFWPKGSQ